MKKFKGVLLCGSPIEAVFPDSCGIYVSTAVDGTVRVLVSERISGLGSVDTVAETKTRNIDDLRDIQEAISRANVALCRLMHLSDDPLLPEAIHGLRKAARTLRNGE